MKLRYTIIVICTVALAALLSAFRSTGVAAKPRVADVAALQKMIDSSLVEAAFTYNLTGSNLPGEIEGTVLAQKNCFVLKTGGMEFLCNGESLWTVLPDDKEVVIGPAPSLDDILSEQWRISNLKITSLSCKPFLKDSTVFVFDTSILGGDWIVTDTRE